MRIKSKLLGGLVCKRAPSLPFCPISLLLVTALDPSLQPYWRISGFSKCRQDFAHSYIFCQECSSPPWWPGYSHLFLKLHLGHHLTLQAFHSLTQGSPFTLRVGHSCHSAGTAHNPHVCCGIYICLLIRQERWARHQAQFILYPQFLAACLEQK